MNGIRTKVVTTLAALALCAAACEDKPAPTTSAPEAGKQPPKTVTQPPKTVAQPPKTVTAPPPAEPKLDPAKVKAFWTWFKANAGRIHDFEKDQKAVFAELTEKLSTIEPRLAFEFGPVRDGVREFTISANGIYKFIPLVKGLVAGAGEVKGFKVQAFRQRKSPDLEVEFKGVKLSPANVYFAHRPAGPDKIDILLHIKDLGPNDKEAIAEPTFLLLDAVLGEYDVMTRIRLINFAPLTDPNEKGLKPLKDLPAVVDALKK